ncbi:MAG: hypothetical protein Sylvanvirus7_33 [Sylvanvirus sp.]|uniref:Uncharacterized protein n=1 Tax=Sylvanvirus sp. TaxID=2487774 RepID=A0A3G5AHP9_9VIRU|nr:MAG: hypothetical protein Sylvanvirus7_33 [Sylvanvirus sp.]
MSNQLKENGIRVILIYIAEAHTTLWPIGLDHPNPQQNFEDRLTRAKIFQIEHAVPYELFVDGWSNSFMNTFHAWPDRYFLVDHQKNDRIMKTSQYGHEGDMDGVVLEDCCVVLDSLCREIKNMDNK